DQRSSLAPSVGPLHRSAGDTSLYWAHRNCAGGGGVHSSRKESCLSAALRETAVIHVASVRIAQSWGAVPLQGLLPCGDGGGGAGAVSRGRRSGAGGAGAHCSRKVSCLPAARREIAWIQVATSRIAQSRGSVPRQGLLPRGAGRVSADARGGGEGRADERHR